MELVKVSIVEYQQKSATIRAQALDRMRNSRRKQPQVALRYVADQAPAFLIHRGDARVAVQHDRPLRFHVPVELADSASRQSHFHTRDGCRDWQFANRDLACPATALDTLVCQREGILERFDGAIISGRRPFGIRILCRQRQVLRAGISLIRRIMVGRPLRLRSRVRFPRAGNGYCGGGCENRRAQSKYFAPAYFRIVIVNVSHAVSL